MKSQVLLKVSFGFSLAMIVILALGLVWQADVLTPPQPALAIEGNWPQIALTLLTDGLERPVHIAHAGDGSGHIFIVEQAGYIRVFQDGTLSSTPFLNITDRVRSPSSGGGNEEGLLSVAFPPDYAIQRYFYVYYTNRDGNNQVSRFYLQAGQSDAADSNREDRILLLEHPQQSNHNGGQLAFGPDGYLYIGTGDGGGGGDPFGNGQNPASLLGKILRIDVESAYASRQPKAYPFCFEDITADAPSQPYQIPPDNPFVDVSGARPEIWALGLRNPWRFSFDRLTNDLYIGDVGQNAIEEIDFQPAISTGGENYGWNILEGNRCYEPTSNCTQPSNYVPPVAEYSHSQGCSVTGGVVYRGDAYPGLQGIYFYADFCSGRIWGLRNNGGWQSQELLASGHSISTFGEGEAGNIYLADMVSGEIFELGDGG